MTRSAVLLTVAALIISPSAALARANPTSRANPGPVVEVSFLEVAEAAAASGAWRVQNTPTITSGTIRDDDKKRSALAFAISGAAAFVGAALWRWVPCRNQGQNDNIAGLQIEGYNKCWDADGNRNPFDTPTKLMIGAGVALELVALGYLLAHRRSQNNDSASDSDDSRQP